MNLTFPLLLILPILLGSRSSSTSSTTSSKFDYVKQVGGVPFAIAPSGVKFPIITKHSRGKEIPFLGTDGKYIGNAARSFGVNRDSGKRKHVGIDLYCYANDIVVATESGKVIGIQGFLGPTKAILIQGKSGVVTLYGEVKNGSWEEFNVKLGSSVKAGQPIARIGVNNAGTYMLHFETYSKGTTKNYPWYTKDGPNPSVLNPTKYLLAGVENDKNS